jgi:hypothetical protein
MPAAMSEPTSVLTFSDLILEVAYKLGIAYYGADGRRGRSGARSTRTI